MLEKERQSAPACSSLNLKALPHGGLVPEISSSLAAWELSKQFYGKNNMKHFPTSKHNKLNAQNPGLEGPTMGLLDRVVIALIHCVARLWVATISSFVNPLNS